MSRSWKLPRIRFSSSEGNSEYSPIATYYMIVVSASILVVFGLLMTFSASAVTSIAEGLNPYLVFARTALIIGVSVVVAAVSALFPPLFWKRWAMLIFVVALGFQVLVLFVGVETGGNRNWINIPIVNQTVQPSELLKLATCLFLATVLVNLEPHITEWKVVLPGVGIPAFLAVGAVLVGGDMGTALIFVAMIMGMLLIAGMPLKWFAPIGLVGAASAALLVGLRASRLRRVLSVGEAPDPSNPTQPAQGLWALGSGGLFGLGPGASRAKWNYLQEANTDYILAIVGEEFGLVGTLSLLVTIGVLIWATFRLAAHSKDPFIRITAAGIGSWLGFQTFVNVATVTGIGPVVGVPFPFISHGGSSFLFTATAVGVLLSFARSEAGLVRRGRFDEETGGRDPRVSPRRRRVRKKK